MEDKIFNALDRLESLSIQLYTTKELYGLINGEFIKENPTADDAIRTYKHAGLLQYVAFDRLVKETEALSELFDELREVFKGA